MYKTRRACLQQFGTMAALGFAASAVPFYAAVSQTPPKATGPLPWTRARPFSPPAIVRTPADLIAARLVPPFGKQFIRGPQEAQKPNKPGIWPGANYMGTTGEREDLGLVVEDASIWLTGQSSPSDMIIWGETHGMVPVHFRMTGSNPDPAGKEMVDVFKYPNATCYPDERVGPPRFQISGPIQPESAHYPSAAYVPYLATKDPYYLQEVQDAATFMIIAPPPGWGRPPGGVPEAQVRAYGWGLNLVAQAYLATKDAEKSGPLPSPLLPSSYWKRVLDANRARFKQKCLQNSEGDPSVALGLVQPERGYDIAFWQHDYLGAAMGWMIWTGQFPEWRENYDWCIRQAINRTSGKSGFPRTRAVQYAVKAPPVSDWAGLAAANGYTETANGRLDVMDRSYGAYLHANLKMATLNNVPGAAESFAWVDPQIQWIPTKWAV